VGFNAISTMIQSTVQILNSNDPWYMFWMILDICSDLGLGRQLFGARYHAKCLWLNTRWFFLSKGNC
jgi:hypothetical protein